MESIAEESRLVIIDDKLADAIEDPEAYILEMINSTPLYIGELRDTIIVNHSIFPDQLLPEGEQKSNNEFQRYFSPIVSGTSDSGNLELKVDTTQQVSLNSVISYPVIIKNVGNEIVSIVGCEDLQLIYEFQDSLGNWQASHIPVAKSGTGIHLINLPPNEIVLSAIPIAWSKNKLKSRIRITNNYSNEY